MDNLFSNQVVLVTGATSGIGAACACLFARRGAAVMLSGRDAQRGESVSGEISDGGGSARFMAGDIRRSDFCDRLVEYTVSQLGRLDILINSAGIWQAATALDTSDELWRDTLDTNLSGLFYASRAAVRVMLKQGGGNIINISSDWGLVGGRHAAAYCASKGAVVLLTKAMALDHAGDGIRINALCPTDTDTPMMDRDYAARGMTKAQGKSDSAASIPLGRMASAENVAQAACFLASQEADFLTGLALPVDGGATAD